MSSPKTGILSLIRFNSGCVRLDGWGVGPCHYCVTPVPIGLGFRFWTGLGLVLGLRGLDLGLGLDNTYWSKFRLAVMSHEYEVKTHCALNITHNTHVNILT